MIEWDSKKPVLKVISTFYRQTEIQKEYIKYLRSWENEDTEYRYLNMQNQTFYPDFAALRYSIDVYDWDIEAIGNKTHNQIIIAANTRPFYPHEAVQMCGDLTKENEK